MTVMRMTQTWRLPEWTSKKKKRTSFKEKLAQEELERKRGLRRAPVPAPVSAPAMVNQRPATENQVQD